MPKTLPPLAVAPFEDRTAPAVLLVTPPGLSWVGAARAFVQSQREAPDPGTHEYTIQPVVATRAATVWLVTETTAKVPEPRLQPTPAPLERIARVSDLGPVRDADPATEARTAAPAEPASAVSAPPAQPESAAAATPSTTTVLNPPAGAPTGPPPVPGPMTPTAHVVWGSADALFLETESAEPPPAEASAVPPAPPEPDEPRIVPAVTAEPAPASPGTPFAGLLPFDLGELEGTAHELLARVAGIGAGIADELGTGSEYAWLGVGALAAAGAVYASRPGRRPRALAGPDGYDSVFARWEGADAAPPR